MQPIGQWLEDAARLADSGRLVEAAECYRRVLAKEPGLADAWFDYARLLRRQRNPDAALAAYQQALDRGVRAPEEAHLNRGVIYSDDLRRPEEAERELNAALTRDPRFVPALLNLANLHEDMGRAPEALRTYQRLLALQPDHGEALARLAGVEGAVAQVPGLEGQLRAALDRPVSDAATRASLGFALGRLLDARGAYDDAYASYSRANADSRASVPATVARYDRAAHERLIDAIIATFQPGVPVPVSEPLRDPPIFICGMFRSGSTLVEQVLAGHPEVRTGGELSLLPALVRARFEPYPSRVAGMAAPQLASAAQAYLADVSRIFPDGARVTDKRPDNYLHIGLIKTLFPRARIVHTRRDPLDNLLSVYFLHLDPRMAYALDPEDIAHHYLQYQRLMAHWHALHGDDLFDFDYDAFVQDPEPWLERLLAFCGLPPADGLLDFARVDQPVRTASVWQVRRPLHARSSGRWRHYAKHLEKVRAMLERQW